MFKRFKVCARNWATYISFGISLSLALAATSAQAQTYTRPSKGTPVTVFDSDGTQPTQLSAVYDMSAFVEAQLDAYLTYPNGTTTTSFNVSSLGRYIKVSAEYDNIPATTSVTYRVLGSDNAAGPFTPLAVPGAEQLVIPNTGGGVAYTRARLVMSPLPYSTTQYTRPQKGTPLLLANKVINTTPNGSFPPTGALDFRAFSAIAIAADVDNVSCRYSFNLLIYGGPSSDLGQMRLLTTANSVRNINYDTSYIVNADVPYVRVVATVVYDSGSGNDCTFRISATPLPYGVPYTEFNRSAVSSRAGASAYTIPGDFTDVSIQTYDYYRKLRIQNVGAGAVKCGPGTGANTQAVVLKGQTTPGDGGVYDLDNYSGTWFCSAVIFGQPSALNTFAY